MGSLQIKNGKFIKDGEEIIAEFGNVAQIKAIRELELYTTQLKEGLDLYPDQEISVTYTDQFKCFCGATIHLEAESEREDYYSCLSGLLRKCKCGKHTFKTYMEYGSLMVKEVEHAN